MNITVQIPDDLAERLGVAAELSRRALEAIGVEAFRVGRLTYDELGRLLQIESAELDQLLGRHGMPQPDETTREEARRAAEQLISQSKGVKLGGISLKDLVNEGRR
jgi:hypothetical protein